MGHSKLINWLNAEIWQDAARQGTRRKSNQISFADPRFKPSWWPKDVWKWEETKSFSKVSEAFWSNYNLDNNFTTFMKFCVCQCLESHRILPSTRIIMKSSQRKNEAQRYNYFPCLLLIRKLREDHFSEHLSSDWRCWQLPGSWWRQHSLWHGLPSCGQ